MRNKKVIILCLIVILLLLANTYAWFIYNSNFDIEINTNVKSWTIEFKENGQVLDKELTLEIESIYPGMEEYTHNITIENKGDVAAELDYKIVSIELFGERKSIGENCSEEELKRYIESLPFSINFELDREVLDPNNVVANYKMTFNWDLGEEGNNTIITEKDRVDTELGIKAYNFSTLPENEGVKHLKIEIQLIAKQKNN